MFFYFIQLEAGQQAPSLQIDSLNPTKFYYWRLVVLNFHKLKNPVYLTLMLFVCLKSIGEPNPLVSMPVACFMVSLQKTQNP